MNKIFKSSMVIALLAIAMIAATAWSLGVQASSSPSTTEDTVLFVPLVFKNVGNIRGRVTESGIPAPAIPVELRWWNGVTTTTIRTTTTDAQGYYRFTDAPSLNIGENYTVRYLNSPPVASRLAYWITPELTSYNAGSPALFEQFDIANVTLVSPPDLSSVSPPVTFSWIRRPATLTDSYELYLYSNDSDPDYASGSLGYVDQYTLNSLPAGYDWGTQYDWDVTILSPGGGYGSSYQTLGIAFSRGIYGRVTVAGQPAAGVDLRMRFYDGAAWSTADTRTTDAQGYYYFPGRPALGTGQEYYVRYDNETDPSRLWVWMTPSVTSYPVAGADVHLEDFDIANIPLVSPPNGYTVTLPYSFYWTPRPATPTDSYEWDLYSFDYVAYTNPLGYVDHFTVTNLPAPFAAGVEYYWDVWVYGPGGGVGECFDIWAVTFTNTGGIASAQLSSRPVGARDMERPVRIVR